MKKVKLYLLLLFLQTALWAQTARDSIRATYEQLPSHLYPTGILHNVSPTYFWSWDIDTNLQWQLNADYTASPYKFPGHIPAPLVTPHQWTGLYSEMSSSAMDTTVIPNAKSFNTADSLSKLLYEVPIAAMHLNFERVIPGAVDSGYLYYDTLDQALKIMNDTLWISRPDTLYRHISNPDSLSRLGFSQHELFAGALTESALYKADSINTVVFGLCSSLFISNQTDPITYSEIDFDNGDGFQAVPFDTPMSIQYDQTGSNENFEKILRLRLHYGNKVVETKMRITIIPNAELPDLVINTNNLQASCQVQTNGFVPKNAKLSIRYGNTDHVLRKPVILVEGFESSTAEYGIIHYEGLANGIIFNENGDVIYKHMALFKVALDSLHDLGYDIVYIDNIDGKDWIQANALNAIKVIQWVNQELLNNGSHEKLVVLGASMGGLVARYALSKMEADGCCHNVRLYGTFDTPHNGAHIPLGLQATAKYLHDEFGWVDQIVNDERVKPSWEKVLKSPAAQQMLLSHLDPSAAQVREDFMHELDSLGHPIECRRIALINGSENGLPSTIADGWKTFVQCEPRLYLPIGHNNAGLVGVMPNLVGIPFPYSKLTLNSFAESRADGVVFQFNNNNRANLIASSILLLHGSSFALQYSALIVTGIISFFNPGIVAIMNNVLSSFQTLTTGGLVFLHALNAVISVFNGGNQTLVVNSPHYSEAPGGTNNTPESIGDALFGLATVITEKHSFIPSVSGLDLDTSLYFDIETQRNSFITAGKIPFDSYWAPGRGDNRSDENQEHVKVTKVNYRWLINHIDQNDELRNPITGAYGLLLTSSYNFGKPSSGDWDKPFLKHLHSVDIDNGGLLSVNNLGVIGFPNGQYNTGTPSHFKLMTAEKCDQPHVRILNGGVLEVGDAWNNNTAELIIREGSSFEIEQGGKLIIEDGSEFVLEEGAELILHAGASILLSGSNSIFRLRGKVTLLNDAEFSPKGEGQIFFEQNMLSDTDVPDFWTTAPNTKISLSEEQGLLQVYFPVDFYAPAVDSMVWKGVNISISPDRTVYISNPVVRFEQSLVFCSDSTQWHEGVRLAGQAAIIKDMQFRHGRIALYNNASLGSGVFDIVRSDFRFNQTGLLVRDASSFTAYHCTASHNDIGVLIQDAQGKARIIGGTYNYNNNVAIESQGQLGVTLVTRETDLKYNATAIKVFDVNVRSVCTDFSQSNIGISAKDNNKVMLSNNAGNTFNGNTIAVSLDNVAGVYLKNGQNNFGGSQWYVQGFLSTINSQSQINVSGNSMPGWSNGISSSIPMNVYWYDLQGNTHGLPIVNWSPTFFTNACQSLSSGTQEQGNELARDILNGFVSGKVVNTANYTNVWLHEALADAAYMVSTTETVFNDLTALARFNEILSSISGTLTDSEREAVQYSLELMSVSLNNAYDQGLLVRNGAVQGSQENTYLQMLTDGLEDLLSANGLNTEEVYELQLSLAQAYRMSEHFDYALQVLNGATANGSPQDIAKTEYWECVCQVEEELLQGLLSPEVFEYRQQDCRMLFDISSKWQNLPVLGFTEVSSTIETGVLNEWARVYPNPASEYLIIQPRNVESDWLEMELIDMMGKVVFQARKAIGDQPIRLSIGSLAEGLYVLKLRSGERLHEQKLHVLN